MRSLELAVKYLAGDRIIGTAAERAGTSTSLSSETNPYPDSIGNVATCQVVGATSVSSPTAPSGLGSNSINFDGTNDFLKCYGLRQAMDTKGSISLWFNQDVEEERVLVFFAESTARTMIEVKTRTDRRLGINVEVDGTAKWAVATTEQYNAYGNWNHVVITHDGTVPKMYLNGSLATDNWETTTDKTVWWTAMRSAGADNITIGCKARYNNAGETDYIDAQMTDIAFWDEALSASQVTSLYASGNGALASTIPTDQTAHFPCQAIEDGTYELGDLAWNNYAPTGEYDNNNNGVVLNTGNSYLIGLKADGIIM